MATKKKATKAKKVPSAVSECGRALAAKRWEGHTKKTSKAKAKRAAVREAVASATRGKGKSSKRKR